MHNLCRFATIAEEQSMCKSNASDPRFTTWCSRVGELLNFYPTQYFRSCWCEVDIHQQPPTSHTKQVSKQHHFTQKHEWSHYHEYLFASHRPINATGQGCTRFQDRVEGLCVWISECRSAADACNLFWCPGWWEEGICKVNHHLRLGVGADREGEHRGLGEVVLQLRQGLSCHAAEAREVIHQQLETLHAGCKARTQPHSREESFLGCRSHLACPI